MMNSIMLCDRCAELDFSVSVVILFLLLLIGLEEHWQDVSRTRSATDEYNSQRIDCRSVRLSAA